MRRYGKYFSYAEFTCKCDCGNSLMEQPLLNKLNRARKIAGVPFVVTSGYRCENHNKNIGGHENSFHKYGLAVDIACDSQTRLIILNALYVVGFTGIGIYENFIHADIGKKIIRSWIKGK